MTASQTNLADETKTFDLTEIQTRLGILPLFRGKADGRYGAATQHAMAAALVSHGVTGLENWNKARLAIAARQFLCAQDGIETGPIDGLIGPQTRYAFDVYAARLNGDTEPETWRDATNAGAPLQEQPGSQKQWPHQQDYIRYFGKPGTNQTRLAFPYPMRLAWDTQTNVQATQCHEKVHDAAACVLARVLDHYGPQKIARLGLDLFGGCLNVRKMRGGSAWSMHSWGIAFDFDPARNQLRWGRDRAAFARPAYEKWFDLWEEEGALYLGRAKNFDWMHVQFARL